MAFDFWKEVRTIDIAAARDAVVRSVRNFTASRIPSDKKYYLQRQISALESQGKYCPPEALAKLRRELESTEH